MPLYEYECQNCHRRVEKIQKFADAPLTVCPHCAGPLERTITAAAFSFQGGGWYKDGYGSAKPTPSGSSEGTGTAAAAGTTSDSATSAAGSAPAASGASTTAGNGASASAPAASAAPAPAAKP